MRKLIRALKHRHWLDEKMLIGSAEWCGLPDLGLPVIKAKIDTGARTSALHACNIEPYHKRKTLYVRFQVHPLQGSAKLVVDCHAKVMDKRFVMSSNGHKERRYVIETALVLGNKQWNIELTLSNRDPLTYRMLLGRQALNHKVIIDPSRSLLQGLVNRNEVRRFYHTELQFVTKRT